MWCLGSGTCLSSAGLFHVVALFDFFSPATFTLPGSEQRLFPDRIASAIIIMEYGIGVSWSLLNMTIASIIFCMFPTFLLYALSLRMTEKFVKFAKIFAPLENPLVHGICWIR